MKNYFVKINKNYISDSFDLTNRIDPDMECKELIEDMMNLFMPSNLLLPSGNKVVLKSIERTRDKNKRWYAKVQLYDSSERYLKTFGVTSDYIGASVYYAQEAGLEQDEIINHLLVSRMLGGHLIFPTWFSTFDEKSWDLYPKGISINMAKGGPSGYYDRIDLTLYALKQYYNNLDSKLENKMQENALWFQEFIDFPTYITFFKLDDIVDQSYNIYDLTSYDSEKKVYTRIIESDGEVSIPNDKELYKRYVAGCEKLITLRNNKCEK